MTRCGTKINSDLPLICLRRECRTTFLENLWRIVVREFADGKTESTRKYRSGSIKKGHRSNIAENFPFFLRIL